MHVEFHNQSSVKMPKQYLKKALSSFEQYLIKKKDLTKRQTKHSLQVVFLNKAAAQKMNAQFRGKNYATDVLSFDAMEPESFGELVLCPEVIQGQAKEHGLTFRDECVYLVFHGLLHLLGYDHEHQNVEAEKMFQLQDEGFDIFLRRDSKNRS